MKLGYISSFEAIVPVDASERKGGDQELGDRMKTMRAHVHQARDTKMDTTLL
jgi:hypothetical protein